VADFEGVPVQPKQTEDEERQEYFSARAASGVLLIVIACALVLLDVFRADFEVNPIVIIAMFVTAAGLFGVDLPSLRR